MFLEEGLDPLQSVFDLHIPDSSALLDPCGKTELGRARGRSLRPRKDTKADGFFTGGSYQPKPLTCTLDLSRSTFRTHIPNEVGNLFFDVRDMFFEPIDKAFEESSEWGSIKLSGGSNQLLTEYITIQFIRNTRKNTLSNTTVRRDVQP